MKKDPNGHGISALGYDGVLRTFDNERNVLDAVGLNPTQIREYYDVILEYIGNVFFIIVEVGITDDQYQQTRSLLIGEEESF
ncbi:hypothetical protein CDV36_010513 [Fusarium kuroshium]|uniref:Uncharacterized protein n=1 Tax=Fusarium kuroshium TaxID=2010991 RepID=A0A3M2RXA7_9HYPO|nr:hypothetical protein CDV36_010513 [Fusarium kuroshium]